MKLRRILALLAVATLLATGAACSSDKDDSKGKIDKKEQTSKDKDAKDKSGKDSDTSEAPTSTVSDDEFATQIKKTNDNIKEAGADECKLVKAIEMSMPDPANSTQMKEFIKTYTLLMNAVADSLGGDTESATAVRDSAKALEKVAADKDYSVDILEDESIGDMVNNDKVNAALMEFGQKTAQCPGMGGPPGADDPGAGGVEAPDMGAPDGNTPPGN